VSPAGSQATGNGVAAVIKRFLPRWEACGQTIVPADDRVPRVMGIVNLTPDSFSDGGQIRSVDDAAAVARQLAADGADLLDLGGESSRPGAEPVPLDEELNRVIPALHAIAPSVHVPLSVDTCKAEVARQAIQAGAVIINDITALRGDLLMARVAADTGAGVVLMHMQGDPQTMQQDPRYDDVVTEVYDFLAGRIEWAVRNGIPHDRIAIDPGIGFGKTNAHSLELLRNLHRFANLGCVILVGISRKGLLGKVTGRPAPARATASAVASLVACMSGARVVRVHDVAPMVDAIRIWGALRGWEEP
jgi:dihydropteroate synthase